MSRADAIGAVPAAPRLAAAIRSSAIDFYYHSWRLVPANVLWGLLLLGAVLVAFVWPVGGLLVAVVLAFPTAGVYRLAALIARGDEVVFSDAVAALREYARPALVVGTVGVLGSLVFVVNIATGFGTVGGPLGWAIATAAAWGLVVLWAWLLVVWPLVVDPRRQGVPLRATTRLAGLLVLAFPLRIGALLLVTALLVVVSTVLFAALVTITVAFVALVGCHYVLPAADRLEARIERGR